MGSSRQGLGSNWTPSEARDLLAVPILHVLLGLAIPLFPSSRVSAPSDLVSIGPTGPGAHYVGGPGFPAFSGEVVLNAKQWQTAVVPVLGDDRWDMTLPINRLLLQTDPRELVRVLGLTLEESFHAAGYGPKGMT